jgi:hydroxymethylpyrimidine/phosphomethylpyrimidine kinase
VLSSAVAARLASGEALVEAVGGATAFLERAVRYGVDVGEGPGAVNPLVDLRDDAAREPTAETTRWLVESLADPDLRPLVPDVGLSVVGATPHAEEPADVAAVEGRIVRTRGGVTAVGGVRFGTESPAATALLEAREADPPLRFGVAVADAAGVEEAFAAHATTATLPDGRRCAFAPTPDAVERAVADGKTD